MGYVNIATNNILSNQNCCKNLTISYTKIGREYLSGIKSNRQEGIKIKYFSLGDNDKDYNNIIQLKSGFIPNITGEDTGCLNGNFRNDIDYPIFHFSTNEIVIKSYKITFLFDKIINYYSPSTNNIEYIISINQQSIFKNNIKLEQLLGLGLTFFTESDAINYFTNIKNNYIKPELLPYITLNPTLFPNNNGYIISDYYIDIAHLKSSDVVIDNSIVLNSNNVSLSSLEFTKVRVPNPNAINNINFNTSIIPPCDAIPTDCSIYYDMSALDETVSIATVYDCIISNFDGWF